MVAKVSMVGKTFTRLTVLEEVLERHAGKIYYRVRCECGTIKAVPGIALRFGSVRSCGCLKREWELNQPKGAHSPNWKGGKRIDDGYVYIYKPGYPKSKKNGYVREHTFVMEEHLGRLLFHHESVHHKNGNKEDNHINNLELWSCSQPSGQRVEDKVAWAREILKLYG